MSIKRYVTLAIVILIFCGLLLVVFIQIKNNQNGVNYLDPQLNELEYYLQFRDSLNVDVSKVAVAWHLDHSLKVINQISDALKNSDPKEYKRNINFIRTLVFIMGSMPRGVGIAPESVTPPAKIITENILSQLEEARQKILEIDTLENKSHFTHSVFGQLNKKQTKKFFKIHTKHHLKIIKDILNE